MHESVTTHSQHAYEGKTLILGFLVILHLIDYIFNFMCFLHCVSVQPVCEVSAEVRGQASTVSAVSAEVRGQTSTVSAVSAEIRGQSSTCVCSVCRGQRSIGSFGTGVTDCCEVPCGC